MTFVETVLENRKKLQTNICYRDVLVVDNAIKVHLSTVEVVRESKSKINK